MPAPVPVLVPVLAVVRLLGPAQVQVQALLARGQETRSAAPASQHTDDHLYILAAESGNCRIGVIKSVARPLGTDRPRCP